MMNPIRHKMRSAFQFFLVMLMAGVLGLSPVWAINKAGTSVAQFLKIGVGARATAMGSAFSGLANDASALYWNPAGAAWLSGPQLFASHTEWFADINYEFLGIVLPFSKQGIIGVSLSSLNVPEMEQTTITQPEGTGIYFDVQDLALGLTYSRRLTERFSFGLTGKYIHQRLFNETASTIAVDIGGYLKTGFKGMRMGMVMSNFGGKLQLDGRDLIVSYDNDPLATGNPLSDARLTTEDWPLPTSFRLGLALDVMGAPAGVFLNESQRLTVTVDGYHVNDAAETLNMGLEYAWNENFFLRGGYRFNHDTERFSFGTGFRLPVHRWMIGTDYALAQLGDLGWIQHINLMIQF